MEIRITENWHNLEPDKAVWVLKSNADMGLAQEEAGARQKSFGKNALPQRKPLSKLRIFLEQFKSPLIYILIFGGIITAFFKEFRDAIFIFAAVFVNTIVGFIQENKANRALRELNKIVKYSAKTIRGGQIKIIDSSEVVPGDIVILNAGDKVPADGRIIEAQNLQINEMSLTGEWLPAKKNTEILPEQVPLPDRDNMAYMGCAVEEGKGKILITGIGANTEIGKIAVLLKEIKEEKTPYQKRLAHFSKIIGIVIGIICLALFTGGILRGREIIEMFTVAVAVAVAAIPEGLPVTMTVILALGMQRILKKNGLVRRLASAETLGSTSVIATDKTGTLTEGKMEVSGGIPTAEILRGEKNENDKIFLFKIAAACAEAFAENLKEPLEKMAVRGRPTDKALFTAAASFGIFKENIKKEEPLIAEVPFSPVYKFSASLNRISEEETMLYAMGAPEKILYHSILDDESRQKIHQKINDLALSGFRIIACAHKEAKYPFEKESSSSLYEEMEEIRDLVFSGLIILDDPIRPDVKEAIDQCRKAGIKLVMVTGDHKLTAKSVAERLGFEIGEILEGKDLEKLSDREFEKKLKDISIYARVEPKHKMRIVQAWQKKGETVAMTGDGVNDTPAIKKADIGVAPGSGTEIAKEVSDLVLMDDSFSIIVLAVEEGRGIIDNIRKVITYLLSNSLTESVLVGASIFVGLPLPITVTQILWVNLIEDGFTNIALGFEPKEKDLMKKKPIKQKAPLLTRQMRTIIIVIGLVTNAILLVSFFWMVGMDYQIGYLRTIIFALLSMNTISYVFSCKSLRKNIWQINIFDNKFLLLSWIVGGLALVSAIYVPFLNNLLGTVPLAFSAWPYIIGLGAVNLFFIEAVKFYFISTKPQ